MRALDCWLLGILAANTVLISAPAASDPKPSAEQLIEKLGDRDFKVREAAAQAIESLGVAALPALKKAQNHPDLEIRKHVAKWIPVLERAATVAPKLVTLKRNNTTLRSALDDIAKQTGYKLELLRDPTHDDQKHDFDFDQVTFWEAVDRICLQAGVVMQPTYGDEVIRFQFQDRYVPYVSRSGAFRVVAQGIDHSRSIQFTSLPKTPIVNEQTASEQVRMTINVYAEPRLPLMGLGEVSMTEARDDQKNTMLQPQSPNQLRGFHRTSYYWGGYRSNSMTTQVSLAPSGRNARKISTLKGLVPVTILAEQKAHVATDAIMTAKGKKLTAANMTLDIQDVKELPNKQYELKMQVSYKAPQGESDHNWLNSLYGRLELQDAKSNKFSIYGSSMSGDGKTAQVAFTFGAPKHDGPPTKLIINEWKTVTHEVPFEFKDVPLP